MPVIVFASIIFQRIQNTSLVHSVNITGKALSAVTRVPFAGGTHLGKVSSFLDIVIEQNARLLFKFQYLSTLICLLN